MAEAKGMTAVKAWFANDTHKIIVIAGVAGLLVTAIVIGVVATLVRASAPVKPAASLPVASAAKPVPETKSVAPAEDTAAIRKLEDERQKLLDDQVTMLRQQNASIHSAAPVSAGERDCKLSGDPKKRDDELRSCFGLADANGEAANSTAAVSHAPPAADATDATPPGLPSGVWGYTGRGAPEYWGTDPRYALCSSGRAQSPVNLMGHFDARSPLLAFSYREEPLRMINTGTTVRVDVPPGSEILIDNVPFQLASIEFHTPSEDWVNGRMADMSFDFLHKNNNGQVAVVTVLANRGVEHPALKSLWDWLPDEVGAEQIFPENRFNPDKILPVDRSKYWYYQGSLTSPPCTESVQHFVLKQTISISDAQFQRFTTLYSFNARPIQPLYGRIVRER